MIPANSLKPLLVLRADPSRTVARLFIPGREEVGPGNSRASTVIERIMQLSDDDVATVMSDIDTRFAHRHLNFDETLLIHAAAVDSRIGSEEPLSPGRRRLLGACFTHEYSIEAAALCNPSIVLAPLQPYDDRTSFVMSVRGVGEGHRSSIGFRTGTVDRSGNIELDLIGPFPVVSTMGPGQHQRRVFKAMLSDFKDDVENSEFVMSTLEDTFDDAQLEARIAVLASEHTTRRGTEVTIANLRAMASSSYRTQFDSHTAISERVLWPHAPAESNGMEDARFVRFTDDSGEVTYYATYTAFDGINIAQHLLETKDFKHFDASPIAGDAATGKGLAIFPRKIRGNYVALSRSDREANTIVYSDQIGRWSDATIIQSPVEPWEIIQLGNCGSPIETDEGWLTITHGVGPMRTYYLAILLLDLEFPERVLARSTEPLLAPSEAHRDGYVPNVVYSCGSFAIDDLLILPFGMADQAIGITSFSIKEILASLTLV